VPEAKKGVRILSSYKPITVEKVGGTLDIKGESSDVHAKDIGGATSIQSSYKTIRAENIGGDLKVDGGSCSVLADGVEGNIDVVNSYKYVILKNTTGSIHVRGDSSPIEVSDIRKLPEGSTIDLFTSYKPVTLDLPADANVKVVANTQYGKIRSDFPVYLTGEDNNQVKIELGTGSSLVKVETSHDIIIRKI
jgi:hypothetical protein